MSTNEQNPIAENVIRRARQLGWTRKELCKQAGKKESTLHRWLNNKNSPLSRTVESFITAIEQAESANNDGQSRTV